MRSLQILAFKILGKRRSVLVCLGLVGLVVSACSTAPAPRDRYYRLDMNNVQSQIGTVEQLFGTLLVDRPAAQGLGTERPILYVDAASPSEVQQYTYHHWEDSPVVLMHRALISGLRMTGVAKTVVSPEIRARYDVELSGKLIRFERLVDGENVSVHVRLELVFENLNTQEVQWLEEFQSTQTAKSSAMVDTVAAFEVAAADIVAQIIARLS